MQRTIYSCDICKNDVESEELYSVTVYIHLKNGIPNYASSRKSMCLNCLAETGLPYADKGKQITSAHVENLIMRILKVFTGKKIINGEREKVKKL